MIFDLFFEKNDFSHSLPMMSIENSLKHMQNLRKKIEKVQKLIFLKIDLYAFKMSLIGLPYVSKQCTPPRDKWGSSRFF